MATAAWRNRVRRRRREDAAGCDGFGRRRRTNTARRRRRHKLAAAACILWAVAALWPAYAPTGGRRREAIWTCVGWAEKEGGLRREFRPKRIVCEFLIEFELYLKGI